MDEQTTVEELLAYIEGDAEDNEQSNTSKSSKKKKKQKKVPGVCLGCISCKSYYILVGLFSCKAMRMTCSCPTTSTSTTQEASIQQMELTQV